jgi:hypothetical protein
MIILWWVLVIVVGSYHKVRDEHVVRRPVAEASPPIIPYLTQETVPHSSQFYRDEWAERI